MLATNIETEVRKILQKAKGEWMRVGKCAKKYAKGNASKETQFYRWRKKVGKGKVEGFQIVELPGNIVFIGLDSADPRAIESQISKNKKILRSVKSAFGFFEWLDRRAERKRLEREQLNEKFEKDAKVTKARFCYDRMVEEFKEKHGRTPTVDEEREMRSLVSKECGVEPVDLLL